MKCKMCKQKIYGRSDKVFCGSGCKSSYHRKLRSATKQATQFIDITLHRNRSILLEIMGKYKTQVKVHISELEKKNFNFNYITNFYVNSRGKTYHFVYDFSWMTFGTGYVLINRRKNSK